jgi:hypothetical protein
VGAFEETAWGESAREKVAKFNGVNRIAAKATIKVYFLIIFLPLSGDTNPIPVFHRKGAKHAKIKNGKNTIFILRKKYSLEFLIFLFSLGFLCVLCVSAV